MLTTIESDYRASLWQAARRAGRALGELPNVLSVLAGGSLGEGGEVDPSSDGDLLLLCRHGYPTPEDMEQRLAPFKFHRLADGAYLLNGWSMEISLWDYDALAKEFHSLVHQQVPEASDFNARWLYYTVVISDPGGLGRALKDMLKTYPERLRRTLLERGITGLEKTVRQTHVLAGRDDLPAFWIALSDFVRQYMDTLFALNRLWRPGNKRFLSYHIQRCSRRPMDAESALSTLMDPQNGLSARDRAQIVGKLHADLLALSTR